MGTSKNHLNFNSNSTLQFSDRCETALSYGVGDDAFVHTEWSSKKYSVTVKPKTIILLNENNEFVAFGKDAKFKFSSLKMKLKNKNRIYMNTIKHNIKKL